MPYTPNTGPHDSLTPQNAVLVLIDHQVGLMRLIDDMPPERAKGNALGLARAAKTLGLPVILTTSRDRGPNGVLLPELTALFPDTEVIRRPGLINAYRWPAFRAALAATGRSKVVVAAATNATCLSFPSLDMVLDGYEVHAVIDASGAETPGRIVRETVVANLSRAGVHITSWSGVVAELTAGRRRDEARERPPAAGTGHDHLPGRGRLPDTGTACGSGRTTPPARSEEGRSEPAGRTPAADTPSHGG